MMRNIVIGLLYPEVKNYVGDYIKSINAQTTKNFELFLFNNHFGDYTGVVSRFDDSIKVTVVDVKEKYFSIIPVRQMIVDRLLKEENVENVIFTDTDDFFDANRIEKTIIALEDEKIVFTDLVPVNEAGVKLGEENFLSSVERVSFADLINKNLLGFSHTAIKWNLLSKIFTYKENLQVGDWWFFASLLVQGFSAVKLSETFTYYRQYGNNIAGMKKVFTEQNILFGLKVKAALYSNLLNYLDGENYGVVQGKLSEMLKLKEVLSVGMENYLNKVNSVDRMFYWWEHIDLEFVDWS